MRQRATVPGLWRAYRQVAPTVETVVGDTEHGSAWLSMRALEVLRDRAAVADDWTAVADVARELRSGHPDMAALTNRINRTMARAVDGDLEAEARTPAAVVAAAQETIAEAARADDRAADRAGELVADATVATISRSGTVLDALSAVDADVLVGESRPAGEGTAVAAELAATGRSVTVTTDAALPWAISGESPTFTPDLMLVGADAVLPDGSVVNKVGTRSLGLAASRAGIPLYVVAASDKIATDQRQPTVQSDPEPLGVDPSVETWTPTFDRTPADCIEGIVTENRLLDSTEVATVAEQHRRHASWDIALD
jgi:translation initiation factor 2B subunit (eIF-2B alpha/beta/delta family)